MKKLLSVLLAVAIVHSSIAWAAAPNPFSKEPASLGEARDIIQAAEGRFLGSFNYRDFAILVQANEFTGLVDDPGGYLEYFRHNRAQLVREAQIEGQPPINWQMFLAQSYVKFKIEKTNALNEPNAFMSWIEGVTKNPYVEFASWKTWAIMLGTYLFIKGVVYGAMVAGPAAGAVNALLNPIVIPLNQKLTVIGNKYIGPIGMRLNSWFFDGKANSTAELESAKEAVEGVRSMIEGRHYEMTNQQWVTNRKALFKVWNRLNYMFNLLPDAYKAGRDRQVDLLLMRPRDFALAATNSINAAEVQRQGAESVLDRVIVKGALARAVEQASSNLSQVIEQQIRFEREAPERSGELTGAIENARSQLLTLGATAEQADRVVENLRNHFVFRRQAAAMLAAQVMTDAMYSDTIEGARNLYEGIFKNTALNHLHGIMKLEVIDILEKLQFNIEAKQATLKSEAAKGDALEKVRDLNRGRDGARTLSEPGNLTHEPARTSEQRAREAVGRGMRR